MRIAHNLSALTAFNSLNATGNALQKTVQRLSTGLRINSASDDAAGLAISEKIRAQTTGLNKAVRNAQDGVSLLQTAEGAIQSTQSILQRMRELAVQASNDTLTSQDRAYIQLEVDELRGEVDRIADTTQFNGKRLLNGSSGALWSSDDVNTAVLVRGGLGVVDKFGQKSTAEGNYRIAVSADAGQAQVQKSNIFKIKDKNVLVDVKLNREAGAVAVAGDDLPQGNYTVRQVISSTELPDVDAASVLVEKSGITGYYNLSNMKLGNRSLLFQQDFTTKFHEELDWDKFLGQTLTFEIAGETLDIQVPSQWKFLENPYYSKYQPELSIGNYRKNLPDYKQINSMMEMRDLIFDACFERGGVWLKKKTDAAIQQNTVPRDSNYEPILYLKNTTSKSALLITMTHVTEDVHFTAVTDAAKYLLGATDEKKFSFDGTEVMAGEQFSIKAENGVLQNANILFEVEEIDKNSKEVKMKATANFMDIYGGVSSAADTFILKEGEDNSISLFKDQLGDRQLKMYIREDMTRLLEDGIKFTYNVVAGELAGADTVIEASADLDDEWGTLTPDVNDGKAVVRYGVKSGAVGVINMQNFYLDHETGNVSEGSVIISLDDDFSTDTPDGTELASFYATYQGQSGVGGVQLRNLDAFCDAGGASMLDSPQTITITQGDGKQTSVTLYANDTLDDLAAKLNDAIANGLGQGRYTNDNAHFATLVKTPGAGPESVRGTLVVRSAMSGAAGELAFSGDDRVLRALGLNTIQASSETERSVTVTDAHTGAVAVNSLKITGNHLSGIIHPNIVVELDVMSATIAVWNDGTRSFILHGEDEVVTLHLSDNGMTFQIGANGGEDMRIHIGDMSSRALGISGVNVTTRERAARSIGTLDAAINRVSAQRARIGAYQNSLEYTTENLTATMTNLTAAESRIRDADMAQTMMELVKLQILNQSGTSMMSQANQIPQQVLSLLG